MPLPILFQNAFAENFMLANYAEDIYNEFPLIQMEKGLSKEK